MEWKHSSSTDPNELVWNYKGLIVIMTTMDFVKGQHADIVKLETVGRKGLILSIRVRQYCVRIAVFSKRVAAGPLH